MKPIAVLKAGKYLLHSYLKVEPTNITELQKVGVCFILGGYGQGGDGSEASMLDKLLQHKTYLKQAVDENKELVAPDGTKYIIVAPQANNNSRGEGVFTAAPLISYVENGVDKSVLGHIKATYKDKLDLTRIVFTGYSGGAVAALQCHVKSNEIAAVLAAAAGKGYDPAGLMGKKVRLFHNFDDGQVKVENSIYVEKQLKALQQDFDLTLLHSASHDSWSAMYENIDAKNWLLSQVLTPPPIPIAYDLKATEPKDYIVEAPPIGGKIVIKTPSGDLIFESKE
jgi:predicted peptidase